MALPSFPSFSTRSDNQTLFNHYTFFFMRKFLSILLAIALGITCLSSCGKDNPGSKEPNPLVGTKWFASYADYLMVLEFTSETDVTGYFAKPNGVYDSGQTTGTYTVSGNTVTFSGITYRWIYAYYRLSSGSINGSLLSTTGQKTFDIETGDWSSWTNTFSRQ